MKRFPYLFSSSHGWLVLDRGADREHLRNVYVFSPPVGRYWLTWSTNLHRWVNERSHARAIARHGRERLERLGRELEEHLHAR